MQETEQKSPMQIADELAAAGKLTPGELCQRLPGSRLNVVLDVDNTLIYSMPVGDAPNLKEQLKHFPQLRSRVHLAEFGAAQLWIVERYSVREALAYLSTFCRFFVYSHGLREYILKILSFLDPEQRYFRDLEETMVAPANYEEQRALVGLRKSFDHFKKRRGQEVELRPDVLRQLQGENLFSDEDLQKILIVDDQIGAVRNNKSLVLSKKFMQFADDRERNLRQRANDCPGEIGRVRDLLSRLNTFQFPMHKRPEPYFVINKEDFTKVYKDYGVPNEQNQMYAICNHVTRLYMHRTLLEPSKSIADINFAMRRSIFAQPNQLKFSFHAFMLGTTLDINQAQVENAKEIMEATENVVIDLGGEISSNQASWQDCSHIVLFRRAAKRRRVAKELEAGKKVVWYQWVLECFFQMRQLDPDADEFKVHITN